MLKPAVCRRSFNVNAHILKRYVEGAAGAAEAGVAVAQGVIDIAKTVSEVVGEDKEARDKFSRMLVDDLTSQYPDYDAVAAVKGDIEGDAVHQHGDLNYKLGLTSQGYEVYAVKHGKCGFPSNSHVKSAAMLLSYCCFVAKQAF